MSIAFGPVPSRRLGKSLGINNIPDKVCTYACVYCQIGRTLKMEIDRRKFYSPEKICEEVRKKVMEAEEKDVRIDYITFVPDGEPTLDINIGVEIEMLKELKIPLAMITNSSLIWRKDVREELLALDFISFKIDAVSENLWKKIDRPHKKLKLEKILKGMLEFRDDFKGKLVTETMLIDSIDYSKELEKIAEFMKQLEPEVAYIAIPTRPPWEKWVRPAKEEEVIRAYYIFSSSLGKKHVEYLIGYEGNAFVSTGNFEKDILSITAVHPMRQEAVKEMLKKADKDWKIVEKLITEGKLMELEYQGEKFYMRRLKSRE